MKLITDEYRAVIEEYHRNTRTWGSNAGKKRVPFINSIVEKHGTQDILDYGSGKATLNQALPFKISSYEPGIPELAALPTPHDIVVSFGAIEHVEPECIDDVLSHIHSITKKIAYLDIGTTSSKHVLPDGRKAHLIVEGKDWWIDRLDKAGFKVIKAEANFDENGTDHNIKLDANKGKGCVMFTCVPK